MAKLLVLAVCAAVMVGWAQGQGQYSGRQDTYGQYTAPQWGKAGQCDTPKGYRCGYYPRYECYDDSQCQGAQKCCSDGCRGYTCQDPAVPYTQDRPQVPGPQWPQWPQVPIPKIPVPQGPPQVPDTQGPPQVPDTQGPPQVPDTQVPQVPDTQGPTTQIPVPQVEYPQVTKKPNECPAVPRFGHYGRSSRYCQDACSDDAGCPGITKCCDSGCGKTCQNPECPRNKPQTACAYNPCDYSECPRYRTKSVVCVPDYCGGCNARWIYKGRKDVTRRCYDYSD